MKTSDLIKELEERLSNYGDIDVKYAFYDGIPSEATLHTTSDVSVETMDDGDSVVVIWDK